MTIELTFKSDRARRSFMQWFDKNIGTEMEIDRENCSVMCFELEPDESDRCFDKAFALNNE